jgi:hypothetical protein
MQFEIKNKIIEKTGGTVVLYGVDNLKVVQIKSLNLKLYDGN